MSDATFHATRVGRSYGGTVSKYNVLYASGSKKELLQIEHMLTPHLCNAWRKLGRQIASEEVENPQNAIAVCAAMKEEIVSRGGVYDHDTDQWVFPPKETTPEDETSAGDRAYHERVEEGLDPLTGRER